jgi:nucleotide-binding universal stress UspA family protein
MGGRKKLRVLIPLDGVIPGEAAIQAIQPLVRSGPVDCTLLHVKAPAGQEIELDAHLNMHRDVLESLGVATRVAIVSGKPSEEILRQVSEGGFDLVAMSTHGRQGMDRVLMGSVAEEVVRSSSVPVLLCRMGSNVPAWEHIVVALNGLTEGEEVLDDALVLARRLGSTVHLLKVGLNLLWSNAYRGVAFEIPPDSSPSYLEDIAARFRGAGLICMMTHGRPEEMPGLDRSVAAEVIRHAPCPVYVRRMTRSSCQTG